MPEWTKTAVPFDVLMGRKEYKLEPTYNMLKPKNGYIFVAMGKGRERMG
jgi:hypothetical protein